MGSRLQQDSYESPFTDWKNAFFSPWTSDLLEGAKGGIASRSHPLALDVTGFSFGAKRCLPYTRQLVCCAGLLLESFIQPPNTSLRQRGDNLFYLVSSLIKGLSLFTFNMTEWVPFFVFSVLVLRLLTEMTFGGNPMPKPPFNSLSPPPNNGTISSYPICSLP